MAGEVVSRRREAGGPLSFSAIGVSLEAERVPTPDDLRNLVARLRAARARGVTTFDLPEGPASERLERAIAAAFPVEDPDLVLIAQRSTPGLERESGRRPARSPVVAGSLIERSLAASDRRLAPQRVRVIDWVPTDGDDEPAVRRSLDDARTPGGVSEVFWRIDPGGRIPSTSGDRPGVAHLSGSLSLLDRRLLRTLEPRAAGEALAFLARDPLGAGRLDGSRLAEAGLPRRPDAAPARVRELEQEFAPVLSLGYLTQGRGRTLAQASLQYVLRRPWVLSALVPLPAPERLAEILGAEGTPALTDDEMARIDGAPPDR